MKRILTSICALALIVTSIGCASTGTCGGCGKSGCRAHVRQAQGCHCGRGCRNGGGCLAGGGLFGGGLGRGANAYEAGPPAPTVAYPYYTTRGPRDFLAANPRGIGP